MDQIMTKGESEIGAIFQVAFGGIAISKNNYQGRVFIIGTPNFGRLIKLQTECESWVDKGFKVVELKTNTKQENIIYREMIKKGQIDIIPAVQLFYTDENKKFENYLLMLTKNGDLVKILSDENIENAKFLCSDEIIIDEKKEFRFLYSVCKKEKTEDGEEVKYYELVTIDEEGVVVSTYPRKYEKIDFDINDSMIIGYNKNSHDIFSRSGLLQAEDLSNRKWVTTITEDAYDIVKKYHIFSTENKAGETILFILDGDTGKIKGFLNPIFESWNMSMPNILLKTMGIEYYENPLVHTMKQKA